MAELIRTNTVTGHRSIWIIDTSEEMARLRGAITTYYDDVDFGVIDEI